MTPQERSEEKIWSCMKCSLPLEMAKVGISYLGNTFPADLLRCPGCGFVFIPEDLALGKILEVERLLEDK